jgi:hypothetical protein
MRPYLFIIKPYPSRPNYLNKKSIAQIRKQWLSFLLELQKLKNGLFVCCYEYALAFTSSEHTLFTHKIEKKKRTLLFTHETEKLSQG